MTRSDFNSNVLVLSRRLYLIAFRFLKRQDEAEDAVQEVFIRLWNKRQELDRYDNLEAIATSSVKNYCIDILRRKKVVIFGENASSLTVQDEEASPHESMEREETARLLGNILKQLPDMYREIITMKEIDGLSYDEIAAITGYNINTLRVTLSRGRKMIRDEFKRQRYEYQGNIRPSRKIL